MNNQKGNPVYCLQSGSILQFRPPPGLQLPGFTVLAIWLEESYELKSVHMEGIQMRKGCYTIY